MKEDEIFAELKKLNENIGFLMQEISSLHQWLREQNAHPKTVRLSADDAYALSRRGR